jgi:hypothetical protein
MMSSFLVDEAFANRLYPGSLAALEHVRSWGEKGILSGGDGVFQPRKVQRLRLWQAVEGRVLTYIHKERMLNECKAPLFGRALRHGGRQTAHCGVNEKDLG